MPTKAELAQPPFASPTHVERIYGIIHWSNNIAQQDKLVSTPKKVNPIAELGFVTRLSDLSDGTPHYRIKLEADKRREESQIKTVYGTFTLDQIFRKEILKDKDLKTGQPGSTGSSEAKSLKPPGYEYIINHDGNFPRFPEEPETYRNDTFEIKKSKFQGLGAFAVRDLKAYEIIHVEKHLFTSENSNLYDNLESLTPVQRQAFNRLHAHQKNANNEKRHAIYKTNSFFVPGGGAIFLLAARFNHACNPANNVEYKLDLEKNIISFSTNRDIPAGTELTIRYADRAYDLYAYWGFRCQCGSCTPPSESDLERIVGGSNGPWDRI
ncbi:hypothetical protein F5Y15DRAFT_412474 [Xylariaceae sp. FL0016]|nr:hypothetical protein F5Y15DRAFT_412474 [Xylariaceae sp. FL0016]